MQILLGKEIQSSIQGWKLNMSSHLGHFEMEIMLQGIKKLFYITYRVPENISTNVKQWERTSKQTFFGLLRLGCKNQKIIQYYFTKMFRKSFYWFTLIDQNVDHLYLDWSAPSVPGLVGSLILGLCGIFRDLLLHV